MPGVALVRLRAVSICAFVAALALAGCSTQASSGVTVSGTTLTIYGSQPPGGASAQSPAADVLDAEQLAFQQNGSTVGKYKVRFIKLDGATLSDNARASVEDKSTIAYLGELEPGTSQISVEINNELGILEVSPVDTAVYLTQATPAVPGSPGKFYPSSSTYHQTFARVVPNSAQEAKALVAEMQSLSLTKLYVASDGGPYGTSIALEVRQDAPSHGLTIVSTAADADAVFFGGNVVATATKAVDQAAVASPSAKLFVSSALYDDAFVAGLSAAAQQNLYVSSPGFLPSGLAPAGRQFVTAFRAAYGHEPAPQAIFGYEAMSAVLAVLKQAGAQAASRSTVVSDFGSLHNRQSVLGTYSIDAGDTTIAPFIFARPEAGRLVPRTQG
jgi:branched-chain amino acid transport system substrate-binding protein